MYCNIDIKSRAKLNISIISTIKPAHPFFVLIRYQQISGGRSVLCSVSTACGEFAYSVYRH